MPKLRLDAQNVVSPGSKFSVFVSVEQAQGGTTVKATLSQGGVVLATTSFPTTSGGGGNDAFEGISFPAAGTYTLTSGASDDAGGVYPIAIVQVTVQ